MSHWKQSINAKKLHNQIQSSKQSLFLAHPCELWPQLVHPYLAFLHWLPPSPSSKRFSLLNSMYCSRGVCRSDMRPTSPWVNCKRLRLCLAALRNSRLRTTCHVANTNKADNNSTNATMWGDLFARCIAHLECSGWSPTFGVSKTHHMLKMLISDNGSMFYGCGGNFLLFEGKKIFFFSPLKEKENIETPLVNFHKNQRLLCTCCVTADLLISTRVPGESDGNSWQLKIPAGCRAEVYL